MSTPISPEKVWNVPYARNPFFTGRDQELKHLHTQLQRSQPQVVTGLGGIGKTQIVVEYAYRYRQEYQPIFWVRADSVENLNASYNEITSLLNLPEYNAQEQAVIIQAVKIWLQTHQGWLLILDNADEPDLLAPFLPTIKDGHLLVTTRGADLTRLGLGFAHSLDIETFAPEQGALFLLHRTDLLTLDAKLDQAKPQDQTLAQQISQELGGLPLALDQAGAYLKVTQSDLATYQEIYRLHYDQLLKEHHGHDHPASIATTWSLSFRRVEERNPAAADFLRLCAFLGPDIIPEEILTKGAAELIPVLAPIASDAFYLNEVIAVLRAYSLIARDPLAKTLIIHRLVQTVLRGSMPPEIQQEWMQRAIQAVVATHPDSNVADWRILERLLPHALTCATWVEQASFATSEATFLLIQAGDYLNERTRYGEAKLLLKRAQAISEQRLGVSHPETAVILNNLAACYHHQGKYEKAELLLKRALTISEQEFGTTPSLIVTCLNNLSQCYHHQGKYEKAELLLKRALAISEQRLGVSHPETPIYLNNLANFYNDQKRYSDAESLLKRALAICEQEFGATHPTTTAVLHTLANSYREQEKYEEAETLCKRVLAISEQWFGATHPTTATSLNNLANLYWQQRKYGEAEPLFQRVLIIREQVLGPEHPDTAQSIWWMAVIHRHQQHYQESRRLYEQALSIYERTLGPRHPQTRRIRDGYGGLLFEQTYDALSRAMEHDKEAKRQGENS